MLSELGVSMRRREFIALSVAPQRGRSLPTHSKVSDSACSRIQRRRHRQSESELQANIAAFLQALQQLGWIKGQNLQIDHRVWRQSRSYPQTGGGMSCALAGCHPNCRRFRHGAVLQATPSVPVVFVNTTDPVGAGYAESLARPGGNATGFMAFEYSLSGKWLELLKQIAPGVTRAGVLRDALTAGTGQFAVIQSVAPSVGIDVSPIGLREAAEIERGVAALARSVNGGLIVTASAATVFHRDLIITLAARYKLPAVYSRRLYVTSGGLISYGSDIRDQFRRAAGYVDRILKGEKPADMPVQAPTKYELVVNLKTAKALGLTIPPSVLARADEVIE